MKDKSNDDHDFEIVQRCKKGDVDAFEELVNKYQKKAFNISYRMTGDYHEAAEVVQDAFVSVYKNIKDFRGKSKFSTWLYSIVVNLSRNKLKQLRARAYKEDCSLDDPVQTQDGQMKVEYASNNPSAYEILERHEGKQKIWGCISTLEAEFRETIVLRDIRGFSYDEISVMLNIAIGTVRSRLHRARLAVKDCLKKFIGDL
jgi:RNA polymerase sigma-70 factor (ECF subfamily)